MFTLLFPCQADPGMMPVRHAGLEISILNVSQDAIPELMPEATDLELDWSTPRSIWLFQGPLVSLNKLFSTIVCCRASRAPRTVKLQVRSCKVTEKTPALAVHTHIRRRAALARVNQMLASSRCRSAILQTMAKTVLGSAGANTDAAE